MANNISVKSGIFLTEAGVLGSAVHASWIHWGPIVYQISGKVIWTFLKSSFFQGDEADLPDVYISTINHASLGGCSFLFSKPLTHPLRLISDNAESCSFLEADWLEGPRQREKAILGNQICEDVRRGRM